MNLTTKPPLQGPNDDEAQPSSKTPVSDSRVSRAESRRRKQRVLKLYEDTDLSLQAISFATDIPRSTVQLWCSQNAHLRPERGGKSNELDDSIRVAIVERFSGDLLPITRIAADLGVSRHAVDNVLRQKLTKEEREAIFTRRKQEEHTYRCTMIERWADGRASYRSMERDCKVSRSTMSTWVRRPDLPPALRAKVAKKLPENYRRHRKKAKPQQSLPAHPKLATKPTRASTEPMSAHAVQALLADIGLAAGMDVWIPANDRSRVIAYMHREGLHEVWPASHLPTELDRIVSQIDVCWFSNGILTHAYEVEHSTTVKDGVGRIRDAQAMYPNFSLYGYIVAPEKKYTKFRKEVARPGLTGAARHVPCEPIRFVDEALLSELGTMTAEGKTSLKKVQAELDARATE